MYKIGIHLINRPSNGGSYQYWLAMLKAISQLEKNKYDIYVYSPYKDWINIASDMGIEKTIFLKKKNLIGQYCERFYRRFPCRLTLFFCKAFDIVLRKVKRENLNLWISQIVDGIADLLSIPAMIPIFDLMHRYENHFPELQQEYEIRENMFIYQCKIAEIILADSEVGKKHIIESYGNVRQGLSDRVKVLPFIPPDYIFHYKLIEDFKYEIYDKYVFYPAQFWTHKNHKRLIEAISLLREKGLEVNLVLVGSEQNNRNNIDLLIHEKGLTSNIKILGYVTNDEMVYLYQHARALVMPTFFGPTNIPQLEAFVLGCPVATSGIYGIPEQVGDAALLFDPNSVDEIADCINKLWTDDELCEKLIQKGKERASRWTQAQFDAEVYRIINNHFNKFSKRNC